MILLILERIVMALASNKLFFLFAYQKLQMVNPSEYTWNKLLTLGYQLDDIDLRNDATEFMAL